MTQSEAAPVPVAAPVSTRTSRRTWLVLAAVLPGMFMNVFDRPPGPASTWPAWACSLSPPGC